MYLYTLENTENRIPILVKEKDVSNRETSVTSPESIANLFNHAFNLRYKAEEHVYLLCADTKMHIVGIFEISHGTVNMSCLSPREIFIRACLCGAVNIILVHNHPSGDPTPSKEDFEVYNRLNKASEIMGISLIDSIIIGDYYYSFNESGI